MGLFKGINRRLAVAEVLAVVSFICIVVIGTWSSKDQTNLRPIDPEALELGPSSSEWFGVYFEQDKIGYAVTSRVSVADGSLLVHSEAAYTIAAMGTITETVLASSALLDENRELIQFDFYMAADPVRIAASGEVRGEELYVELHQGGETQALLLPIEQTPQLSLSLGAWIESNIELAEGISWEVPYFDPVTLSSQSMLFSVVGTEILEGGEEAFWIAREVSGVQTRTLVTPSGQTLREESPFGFSMVRESAEQARMMPDGSAVVDLIEISMVDLEGRVRIGEPQAAFVVSGVSAERFMSTPPLQSVDGNVVRTNVPDISDVGIIPIEADSVQFAQYLEATPFIPVEHRKIEEQSAEILEDLEGRLEATRALVDWVYGYLEKRSTVGVPNALEVLEVGQGDCNEHTVLFVALARAAGIPTKTVAGMVFLPSAESESVVGAAELDGAFYYHAWPEVFMGEEIGWLAVDPTFGEFPASAVHLKVVEGGLDKQTEIMGMLGRVRLSVDQDFEREEGR